MWRPAIMSWEFKGKEVYQYKDFCFGFCVRGGNSTTKRTQVNVWTLLKFHKLKQKIVGYQGSWRADCWLGIGARKDHISISFRDDK